jgi:hypothetical protein
MPEVLRAALGGAAPALLIAFGTAAAQVKQWPPVAPTSVVVFFASGKDASLGLEIKHAGDGSTLYVLDCHTFAFEDPDFNYSGDFECRLRTASGDAGPLGTLLADRRSERDWDSRGRFLREEVEGDCGRHPDYGLRRRFRLRGMSLTIAMSDLTLVTRRPAASDDALVPAFRSFRVRVDVKRDDAATSEIAEVPPARNPLRPGDSPGTFRRDCRPEVSHP